MNLRLNAALPAATLLLLAACGEATPAEDALGVDEAAEEVEIDVPEMEGEEVVVPEDEVAAPEQSPESVVEALEEEPDAPAPAE